jgi:hypothetical protein
MESLAGSQRQLRPLVEKLRHSSAATRVTAPGAGAACSLPAAPRFPRRNAVLGGAGGSAVAGPGGSASGRGGTTSAEGDVDVLRDDHGRHTSNTATTIAIATHTIR